MTQRRTPLTFADAMTRVAGAIGYPEASRIVSRSDRCVRSWSEPDGAKRPTIEQALRLDLAFRLAGGEGAPFRDAFDHQLGLAVSHATACRAELTNDIAEFAQETGEAVAASLALVDPAASPLIAHRALVEAEQARRAADALVTRVTKFLPHGTGSHAGNTGGDHQ